MTFDDLAKQPIENLSKLIESKEVSPVELLDSIMGRIDKYESTLKTYIRKDFKEAKEAAKKAEEEIIKGDYKGPLHGIPLAVKDNIYTKDKTATMGSKIHQGYVPDHSSTAVDRLGQAGAIFTGSLNMHEYAWGATTDNPVYGTCRNPWDLNRIPGGSSGGSGAAIAADLVTASLGTDTGGSIRIPASVNSIVGFKPTHGLVSKYGSFPLSWSLDCIGPMTKTVKDSAIILDAIAGYDAKDPTSVKVELPSYAEHLPESLEGITIGINEDYFLADLEPEVEKLVRDSIQTLKELGAEIKEVKLPSLDYVWFAQMTTIQTEGSTVHHSNLVERPGDFAEDVRILLKIGEVHSGVDYIQAQQMRLHILQNFQQAFQDIDVIVTPTLPFTAPEIGANEVELNGRNVDFLEHFIRYTIPASSPGLPAISIPCGFSKGLPVGLQIMGDLFQEKKILDVAYAFEKATTFHQEKPTIRM